MIDIDVIGALYTPGTFDVEGNELTPAVALAGYHVNTTAPVSDWAQFKVDPETPSRLFGGHETHFYTFADKAEFDAFLATADLSDPVPAPTIPDCAPRQIRKALTAAGLREAVESAIASGDQDTKDWWAYAANFERNHPMVVDMGLALGKTPDDLDALFTLGASL